MGCDVKFFGGFPHLPSDLSSLSISTTVLTSHAEPIQPLLKGKSQQVLVDWVSAMQQGHRKSAGSYLYALQGAFSNDTLPAATGETQKTNSKQEPPGMEGLEECML